jgi:BlaI family transcriptional regulator, penicillinase repressor
LSRPTSDAGGSGVRSGSLYLHLSRRESQIMDVVFHLGEATVAEVVEGMPDEPGYNTVRNTMAVLEKKGYLKHHQEGQRYRYSPVDPVDGAKESAVVHLVDTFFDGSIPEAVRAMLRVPQLPLSGTDLAEISRFVEDATNESR